MDSADELRLYSVRQRFMNLSAATARAPGGPGKTSTGRAPSGGGGGAGRGAGRPAGVSGVGRSTAGCVVRRSVGQYALL